KPQQLGRLVFGPLRQDVRFDNVFLLENSASSTYHGLTLSVRKRITEKLELLMGYTFSRTIDDASQYFEQPENPFNLHAERALSAQHQKHRFTFSALFELECEDESHTQAREGLSRSIGRLREAFGEFEIAPIVTVGSGRPFSPLVGFDANR